MPPREPHTVREAADPATAVILLDVVLGHGSHPDPTAALASACERAARNGYGPAVVGYVLGTEQDPQGRTRQERTLTDADCMVRPDRCAGRPAGRGDRRPSAGDRRGSTMTGPHDTGGPCGCIWPAWPPTWWRRSRFMVMCDSHSYVCYVQSSRSRPDRRWRGRDRWPAERGTHGTSARCQPAPYGLADARTSGGGAGEIWTIGHWTCPEDAFVRSLQGPGIQLLADVRSQPGSRRNPQFGQEAMQGWLRRAGIGYAHLPELGGRRGRQPVDPAVNAGWRQPSFKNYADYTLLPAYEEGIRQLVELATAQRVAIICGEPLPWRCHRLLIANTLAARAWTVWHHRCSRTTATPARPVGCSALNRHPRPIDLSAIGGGR